MLVDVLTSLVALGAVVQLRERAKRAQAADVAYRAPWALAAVWLGRWIGSLLSSGRRLLVRLHLRQARTVTGHAEAAVGFAASARGIVGAPGSVEYRVGALEHRADDSDKRIGEVEHALRSAMDSGDRRTLVEAIGPGWSDLIVTGLAVAAAVAAVLD